MAGVTFGFGVSIPTVADDLAGFGD